MKFEDCKKGMKVKYEWDDETYYGVIYKVSKDVLQANQIVLIQGHKDKHLVFTRKSLDKVEEVK